MSYSHLTNFATIMKPLRFAVAMLVDICITLYKFSVLQLDIALYPTFFNDLADI